MSLPPSLVVPQKPVLFFVLHGSAHQNPASVRIIRALKALAMPDVRCKIFLRSNDLKAFAESFRSKECPAGIPFDRMVRHFDRPYVSLRDDDGESYRILGHSCLKVWLPNDGLDIPWNIMANRGVIHGREMAQNAAYRIAVCFGKRFAENVQCGLLPNVNMQGKSETVTAPIAKRSMS